MSGPIGILCEGARTNRALHNQAFSNAVWVSGGGGIAVTDNTAVAPDGTTTADTLTASGANGTLIQDLGVVASAAKAGGLWLKRKTGTGNVDITLDGGTAWTTQTINAVTWTRCEKTQTLADEDFGIRLVTSGDEVYAWNAQVETAAFLSSDIGPVTTIAVARNADVLTYAGAGNNSATAGSAYAEVAQYPTNSPVMSSSGGEIQINLNGGTQYRFFDGVNNNTGVAITTSTSVVAKVATSWSGVLGQVAANGTSAAATTFDGGMTSGTAIYLMVNGSSIPTAPAFGNLRNVRVWASALSGAQLVTVTTP